MVNYRVNRGEWISVCDDVKSKIQTNHSVVLTQAKETLLWSRHRGVAGEPSQGEWEHRSLSQPWTFPKVHGSSVQPFFAPIARSGRGQYSIPPRDSKSYWAQCSHTNCPPSRGPNCARRRLINTILPATRTTMRYCLPPSGFRWLCSGPCWLDWEPKSLSQPWTFPKVHGSSVQPFFAPIARSGRGQYSIPPRDSKSYWGQRYNNRIFFRFFSFLFWSLLQFYFFFFYIQLFFCHRTFFNVVYTIIFI